MIPKRIICLEDLPIPQKGEEYYLPAWDARTSYRATAWAYMQREDGGNLVFLMKQGEDSEQFMFV